jgi:hypothetical protein
MNPPRERFRSLLLVFAIALLFASELDRFVASWRQPLFFAHLGAFLLWQPVVAANRRMGLRDTFFVAGGALAITLLLNPWVMLLWSAFVAALVGGRVFDFSPRDERWLHLGALAFLLAFLFALVLPDLLPEPLRSRTMAPAVRVWTEIALAVTLLLMLAEAFRLARRTNSAGAMPGMYDPVHSVWILLLLLVVSFSGIALMALGERGYLASIGITLISVGALLLTADLLLRGGTGGEHHGGLVMLFSRYLLSYAIPYEQWLERLARLSREESDPTRFFAEAMRAVGELAPVRGVAWEGAIRAGNLGDTAGPHQQRFAMPVPDDPGSVIEIRIATRHHMSAAMAWHIRLLVQVAVQFHAAKAREERLRAQQYMRAVHETGARLTHDVKNLLQSLDGLVAAAGSVPEDLQVRQLVTRQLPEISRRLAQTLAKLQQPTGESRDFVAWPQWWSGMRAQYESQGVKFAARAGVADTPLPAAPFASVADNLLQNALQKRKSEPGLGIRATIEVDGRSVRFGIEDDGDPVEAGIAGQLFAGPVASRNGLGIGLYQMGRLAAASGMRLHLDENRRGKVRFELVYPGADDTVAAMPPSTQPEP